MMQWSNKSCRSQIDYLSDSNWLIQELGDSKGQEIKKYPLDITTNSTKYS